MLKEAIEWASDNRGGRFGLSAKEHESLFPQIRAQILQARITNQHYSRFALK